MENTQTMKDIRLKIKLIYLPFLLLSIGFIVTYTFLHWLLVLKLAIFEIDELYADILIPLCFPWIPVLLILRKRIKLLNLKTKRGGDRPFFYQLIAVFAIAIPAIIAQGYMKTSTGKLSYLESPEQIDLSHMTKYYQFKNVFLDKRFTGLYWYTNTSGKYNEHLNFHAYFTIPMLTSMQDTARRYFSTWYALEYRDEISNRKYPSEKESAFRKFQQESLDKYGRANLNQFVYFDRIGTNDLHKGVLEAVKATSNYNHTVEPVILIPVNELFEQRNGHKLGWMLGAFAIGSLIWLLMILFPTLSLNEIKRFSSHAKPKSRSQYNYKTILSYIIPNPGNGFGMTHLIMELNIVVFLAMVFSGMGFLTFNGGDLMNWGANYRPAILSGEYWRLFSCTFLHGGLMHLLMNMYGLLMVGLFLEPILNYKRYALFYVLSGIMSSVFSVWWHPATVSVGASGAIFGLYGIFLALLLTKLFPREFKNTFLVSTLVFVGYNLLFGLTGGIDNAAHIGGLLTGLTIGFLMYPALNKEKAMSR